ncbi:hypothetical protein [Nocardia cyriacigeorgica]|uniref:hypothetical protein n=1 Tax=Nocardia cyriacigeorgica TaxID=135487 RepID=UPI001893FE18|nr:hypothetical protein [Nocardia cyriacigeorgica]MBF6289983.1 hypothetical protein [Nocardia cyriacigeorgica]
MDPVHALALLELDPDLQFPAHVVHAIGDRSLAIEVQAEFDDSLRWFAERLARSGEDPVTLVDVLKLDFFIWGCMPADLTEDWAAADAVEDHLDHVLEVVRGIVIDSTPREP